MAGLLIDYIAPSLDTTLLGTSQLLFQLGRHPEQWDLVRGDPTLIPRAVDEALRFDAPVRAFTRLAIADYDAGGTTIPAGDRVLVLFASANRDERHFADPDRFDLHRPESDPKRAFTGGADHLAFGGGRHFCLGAVLSRFEIEVAMSRMFDALPDLRLANSITPPDVGLFLRGPATLPVRFSKPA